MQDIRQHPHYEEARCHARSVRGFYGHALIYAGVVALLLALGLASGHGPSGALWTALWWGIGVLSHGAGVFAAKGPWVRDWEERQVRRYLERRG